MELPEALAIPTSGPLSATIRPPGSKSLTNRALICAALAQGRSQLRGALESEDTQVMVEALRQLGLDVQVDKAAHTIDIVGSGGKFQTTADPLELYIANSGTTVRFLTAALTLGQGKFRLDGTPRMRERPIQDLIDALEQLGGDVQSESGTGAPPVIVDAHGLAGGQATMRGDVSSQYLSAVLMAAPLAQKPVELLIDGPLVSQPYVEMTLAVMKSFGATAEATPGERYLIAPQAYEGQVYNVEPDASAASYFLAAAAICGGTVRVEGLSSDSLQGDVAFADVLAQMGCEVKYLPGAIEITAGKLQGVEVDMNAISDTVQTLAAVAVFADGPTTVHGVAHVRHKETDRIGALVTEVRKLGAGAEELPDGLRITPAPLHGATIDTYDDHRMAMSLSLVGLRQSGVLINDPACTGKTYPHFFQDLFRLIGCASN